MMIQRLILLFLIFSTPVVAKDVTYRLTDAEPLTFTIPDDWSSGWGIMRFQENDPDVPPDFLVFGTTQAYTQEKRAGQLDKRSPKLMIDARNQTVPLSIMKQQLTEVDKSTQTIISSKPIYCQANQTLIGYYNTRPSRKPGNIRLDAFWNLGSRAWTANIKYPPEQSNWVSTCVAIIESVRLADPDTAPPTPKRPTMDGVEDTDFPEELMKEWRSHHE